MKQLILSLIYLLLLAYPAVAAPITIEDAFSPHQGATELVIKAISQAHKTVHVAAYSFTSKPIGSALVAAHDRGVDVEIVFDKSQANSHEKEYIAMHGIP